MTLGFFEKRCDPALLCQSIPDELCEYIFVLRKGFHLCSCILFEFVCKDLDIIMYSIFGEAFAVGMFIKYKFCI